MTELWVGWSVLTGFEWADLRFGWSLANLIELADLIDRGWSDLSWLICFGRSLLVFLADLLAWIFKGEPADFIWFGCFLADFFGASWIFYREAPDFSDLLTFRCCWSRLDFLKGNQLILIWLSWFLISFDDSWIKAFWSLRLLLKLRLEKEKNFRRPLNRRKADFGLCGRKPLNRGPKIRSSDLTFF